MQTINTLQDAQVWFSNSGVANWEWFDGFNKASLIEFAYRNSELFSNDGEYLNGDAVVEAFLNSANQNPADYSIH